MDICPLLRGEIWAAILGVTVSVKYSAEGL